MKKILSLGLFLFLFSCTKESTTTLPETVIEESLQAKVDGVSFNINASYFYISFDSSYNIAANYLDGNTSISTSFSLTFYGNKTGTFPISAESNAKAKATLMQGVFPNILDYTAQSGTLVITKLDTVAKKISGTFNFVAKENNSTAVKTITEGKLVNVKKL